MSRSHAASPLRVRHVVGCMTGTSLDGLDAALVRVEGDGLSMRARFVHGVSLELGPLAAPLRDLAEQRPTTAGAIARVMLDFAHLHVHAVRTLLAQARPLAPQPPATPCDLVCVHGQTVFHAPPLSWQLFQPAPLAHALGVPVVCDLRQMDLAMGGQGAPITPLADVVLYRDALPAGDGAIVNLGGFVNITRLPADRTAERVRGGDVCACNQLLDALARELLGSPFDHDGREASRGVCHPGALADLCKALQAQAQGGRSLGTGDETHAWIARWRGAVPACDLARTACEAIARQVCIASGDVACIVLAGGGVRNAALRSALHTHATGARVATSDELGVPGGYREAAGFAVLGALAQDGVPFTLPAITGRAPGSLVGGAWAGCVPGPGQR